MQHILEMRQFNVMSGIAQDAARVGPGDGVARSSSTFESIVALSVL
jgi:hypothetical protein